jgi:hypothetical protein
MPTGDGDRKEGCRENRQAAKDCHDGMQEPYNWIEYAHPAWFFQTSIGMRSGKLTSLCISDQKSVFIDTNLGQSVAGQGVFLANIDQVRTRCGRDALDAGSGAEGIAWNGVTKPITPHP